MIDPLQQAIDVVKQCWPELATAPISTVAQSAINTAQAAQEDRDWLLASAFSYKSLDTPTAYIVILWRHVGSGDTAAKIQIKPVLVHWDVDKNKFTIVDITRME